MKFTGGLSLEQMKASIPDLTDEEKVLLDCPIGLHEIERAEALVADRAKRIRILREQLGSSKIW